MQFQYHTIRSGMLFAWKIVSMRKSEFPFFAATLMGLCTSCSVSTRDESTLGSAQNDQFRSWFTEALFPNQRGFPYRNDKDINSLERARFVEGAFAQASQSILEKLVPLKDSEFQGEVLVEGGLWNQNLQTCDRHKARIGDTGWNLLSGRNAAMYPLLHIAVVQVTRDPSTNKIRKAAVRRFWYEIGLMGPSYGQPLAPIKTLRDLQYYLGNGDTKFGISVTNWKSKVLQDSDAASVSFDSEDWHLDRELPSIDECLQPETKIAQGRFDFGRTTAETRSDYVLTRGEADVPMLVTRSAYNKNSQRDEPTQCRFPVVYRGALFPTDALSQIEWAVKVAPDHATAYKKIARDITKSQPTIRRGCHIAVVQHDFSTQADVGSSTLPATPYKPITDDGNQQSTSDFVTRHDVECLGQRTDGIDSSCVAVITDLEKKLDPKAAIAVVGIDECQSTQGFFTARGQILGSPSPKLHIWNAQVESEVPAPLKNRWGPR